MDFNRPVGMDSRVVRESEHNGQPARVVSGSRVYAAELADLWGAVTSAERIPHWFLPITGELKLGGRYQLKGHAGGEITRCDPPEALDITWECQDNVSWVTLRFEPLEKPGESETRLTLAHAMSKDEAGEKHWKQYGPGATGVGWELAFLGLGMHLDSGEAVDQAESQAWMATEPGKVFIRRCADAWSAAHVSSGAAVEVASEMATATAQAYCGEAS